MSCHERHDPRSHCCFHFHFKYPSTSDPYENQNQDQDQNQIRIQIQSRATREYFSTMPATATVSASAASAPSAPSVMPSRKTSAVPEKKYKCQFCNRAFSRSEHRSRHERSRKSLIYISFPSMWGWPAMAGSSPRNLSLNTTHPPFSPHSSTRPPTPHSPLSWPLFSLRKKKIKN